MDAGTSTSELIVAVPARLKLVITNGPCKGQKFDTANFKCAYLTVGRTKKANICIKDKSISEKHAELKWNSSLGSWTLSDAESSNGTYLNEEELEAYRAYPLKTGDEIYFGDETLVTVQVKKRSLDDVDVETLLWAHVEAVCQAFLDGGEREAGEMERRCIEQLDDLAAPGGTTQSRDVLVS